MTPAAIGAPCGTFVSGRDYRSWIGPIAAMLTGTMSAPSPAAGWLAHLAIGTVLWGGLFAWLDPSIPARSHWLKGVIFGIGARLLMMIVLTPLAGAGFFAANFGPMAPVMTFVLHAIFGTVLGGVYGAEQPEFAPRFN